MREREREPPSDNIDFLLSVQGDSSSVRPGLGWVDFDMGVPSPCPAAQPFVPNSKVNPTQVSEQMNHSVQGVPSGLRPGWVGHRFGCSTMMPTCPANSANISVCPSIIGQTVEYPK